MPGLLSADVEAYLAFGRVGAETGAQPVPRLAVGRDRVRSRHASPYGPLWTDLSVTLARLTAARPYVDQLLAYRLLGAAAHLLNCFFISRLVADDAVGRAASPSWSTRGTHLRYWSWSARLTTTD